MFVYIFAGCNFISIPCGFWISYLVFQRFVVVLSSVYICLTLLNDSLYYFCHQVDITAGGPGVPEGINRLVAIHGIDELCLNIIWSFDPCQWIFKLIHTFSASDHPMHIYIQEIYSTNNIIHIHKTCKLQNYIKICYIQVFFKITAPLMRPEWLKHVSGALSEIKALFRHFTILN